MRNIMYLGIQEGFSVDNVEYLERELKFKPKLLVGEFSKKDREKCIKKKYLIQNSFDALLNKKKNIKFKIPKKLIKFIKKHEKIYKPMCSRFEYNKNDFDDNSINNYINIALVNWYSFIIEKKINLVFFLDSPHRIYDYIIYLICKFKKIPTIYFRDPNFDGKMVMESDFERSPSGIADLFKKTKIRKNISKKINKEISNKHYQKFDKHKIYFNFEKIKQRLEQNHYVEKNIKISYLYFYLNYIFGKIHPLTKNPFRILKFKKELRPATGYEYIYWIARATLKTFILNIFYYLFSTNKLPKKYILFAMSYQPEATSYPDAGIFHNQIEIITKISTIIDKNTNIIVKEHPMQLNLLGPFNYKNSQIRDLNVYNKLLKLKNVKLLSQNFNMDEATKKADYTLTINGSVALQSVKNGTPVLTFGHAWYVGCSSVYKLKSILEIKYFLNSKKFKIVDKSKIIHFMDCLDKMSISLWYKKFHKVIYSFSKLTKKKNRENIKKIIRRDLKHFYKIYV